MQLSNKKFTSNITTKVLYIMFWHSKTYAAVHVSANHNACNLYVLSTHQKSRQSSLFTHTHARAHTHNQFLTETELQNTRHITCITVKQCLVTNNLKKKEVIYHVQK